VLFSNDSVVKYVNDNFEPVWESVRPVPILKLDFGNGTVVTRTLHGNIATYACTAEGKVLDILPGIYTPEVYLDRLQQLQMLARYVRQGGPRKGEERFKEYHEKFLAAAKQNDLPPRFVGMPDVSKLSIEGGIKVLLLAGKAPTSPENTDTDPALVVKEDLANWKALKEDTELNESVRRQQIHEMLAAEAPVAPEKVTKKLYKDVLHADLDDPYLGLGKLLFDQYAFGKEDRN
jgi:hypothetical protein